MASESYQELQTIDETIQNLVSPFAEFSEDELGQFESFKSTLEGYFDNEVKAEVLPIVRPHVWLNLLISGTNLLIARYIHSFGVAYEHPSFLIGFLKSDICKEISVQTDTNDLFTAERWSMLQQRIDSIIKWFIQELGINPNTVIAGSYPSKIRGVSIPTSISIFSKYCLLRGNNEDLVFNYAFQRLVFYGGDCFKEMSLPLGTLSLFGFDTPSRSIFDWICGWDSSATFAVKSQYKVPINGWIAIVLFVFRGSSSASQKQIGPNQMSAIGDIIMSNGLTMRQNAASFSSSSTEVNMAACIYAGLTYKQMKFLNDIGIIDLRSLTPETGLRIMNTALVWGSLDIVFFLVDRGFSIPDDATEFVRPDLRDEFSERMIL